MNMMQKDTATDRELVNEIIEGNEKAFSVLFFRYLPVLSVFATRFTKSEDSAEEIIQDAFIRVWLNRDKLAGVDNVKAYLYKYVSNEALSHLRKKLKQEKMATSFAASHTDSDNNTVEEINLRDVTRIVAAAIEKLPTQRKKIYQLSRNDGKTIPEIAEVLQISPNTVKNSLVTSLKFIRLQLEEHGILFVFPIFLGFFKIK